MEPKEIFDESKKLNEEIEKLKKQIENINLQYHAMMEFCPHEIVFKYNDNYPRKMIIDGNYFCPACGKIITLSKQSNISSTQFKNSRVIPLVNLSLFGTPEVHNTIRQEVYSNVDYYYDKNRNVEEMSSKMESILQEQNINCDKNKTLIRKIRY